MILHAKNAILPAMASCLFLTAPVYAQSPEILDPFKECSAITGNDARLKCYDNATQNIEKFLEEMKAKAQERKRQGFGFSGRQIDDTGAIGINDAVLEKVNSVSASISNVVKGPLNVNTLYLDNGQVWRTTTSGNFKGRFRESMKVDIKRGAVSGYKLTIEGRSGFKGVERVR